MCEDFVCKAFSARYKLYSKWKIKQQEQRNQQDKWTNCEKEKKKIVKSAVCFNGVFFSPFSKWPNGDEMFKGENIYNYYIGRFTCILNLNLFLCWFALLFSLGCFFFSFNISLAFPVCPIAYVKYTCVCVCKYAPLCDCHHNQPQHLDYCLSASFRRWHDALISNIGQHSIRMRSYTHTTEQQQQQQHCMNRRKIGFLGLIEPHHHRQQQQQHQQQTVWCVFTLDHLILFIYFRFACKCGKVKRRIHTIYTARIFFLISSARFYMLCFHLAVPRYINFRVLSGLLLFSFVRFIRT